MLNNAIIMGRMVRDPELKYTPGNVPVCSFAVAVERDYQQEGQKTTDFLTVVAWRKTAEFLAKWFTKGQMICVVGSIQTRKYKDKTGTDRTAVEIVADKVQFCGKKDSGSQNTPPPAQECSTGFDEMEDDGEIPF